LAHPWLAIPDYKCDQHLSMVPVNLISLPEIGIRDMKKRILLIDTEKE
jgi:hypothetical protein